jgi:phage shock protein C
MVLNTPNFEYLCSMINRISQWFEHRAFGVCQWLGKRLGIKTTTVRMYFIYLSFFTFGSPIIVYFIMAFMLEHKDYFKPFYTRKRPSVWDID